MNLHQFQLLNRQAQVAVLFNRGIYLSTHEFSSFTIDLYRIEQFFIEVIYSQTSNEFFLKSFYSIAADRLFIEQSELRKIS